MPYKNMGDQVAANKRYRDRKRSEELYLLKSAVKEEKKINNENHQERFRKIKRIVADLYAIEEKALKESTLASPMVYSSKTELDQPERFEEYRLCMMHLKEKRRYPFYIANKVCSSRFLDYSEKDLLSNHYVKQSEAFDEIVVWQEKERELTGDFEYIINADRRAIMDYSREAAYFIGYMNQLLEKGRTDEEIKTAVKPLVEASIELKYWDGPDPWLDAYLGVQRRTFEELKRKRELHEEAKEIKDWYEVEHQPEAKVIVEKKDEDHVNIDLTKIKARIVDESKVCESCASEKPKGTIKDVKVKVKEE